MTNNFFNKKGTDKILSLYWFLVVVIVSFGIIAMVYNFYGAPYDVREFEVNLLANKIADCVSQRGELNSDLFYEDSEEILFDDNFSKHFFEICDLNFEVEDESNWKKNSQYFSEIEFFKLNDLENPVFSFLKGNLNYRSQCFIKDKKGKDFDKLPKCVEKRFYSVSSFNNSEQYLIKILVGVGKSEKNVKR